MLQNTFFTSLDCCRVAGARSLKALLMTLQLKSLEAAFEPRAPGDVAQLILSLLGSRGQQAAETFGVIAPAFPSLHGSS